MKFYRKDFYIDKQTIFIIPSVVIDIDNMIYAQHNISIQFHWLCFHARLMWMKGENE